MVLKTSLDQQDRSVVGFLLLVLDPTERALIIASGTLARESKYLRRDEDEVSGWMDETKGRVRTDGRMDGCEVSHRDDKNAFGTRRLYALNLGKRQKRKVRRLCHTKKWRGIGCPHAPTFEGHSFPICGGESTSFFLISINNKCDIWAN